MISELLTEAHEVSFDVEWVDRLSSGLARLRQGGVDVALVDLSLPDSQGIDTLKRLYEQAPYLPLVVLTGLEDERLGMQLVRAGAQDYLVKGQISATLLVRSLRYAIERKWLLTQVEETQQREQQERELRSLDQLSRPSSTAVTAQLFGGVPLHQSVADTFGELLRCYGELLDLALEQRMYRMEHHISEELYSMAEQMGVLKAGPRDVTRLHTAALKEKTQGVPYAKAQAYIEEGRLMLLELMGHLASFYRKHTLGTSLARVQVRRGHTPSQE